MEQDQVGMQSPAQPQTPLPTMEPAHKTHPLVWVLIAVIGVAIIALAAYYFYIETPGYENVVKDEMSLTTQEPDNTAQIEAELQSMDMESLDSEMNDIDKELQ